MTFNCSFPSSCFFILQIASHSCLCLWFICAFPHLTLIWSFHFASLYCKPPLPRSNESFPFDCKCIIDSEYPASHQIHSFLHALLFLFGPVALPPANTSLFTGRSSFAATLFSAENFAMVPWEQQREDDVYSTSAWCFPRTSVLWSCMSLQILGGHSWIHCIKLFYYRISERDFGYLGCSVLLHAFPSAKGCCSPSSYLNQVRWTCLHPCYISPWSL